MTEKYFVPLDKNKKNWDLKKTIIFLDRFFEIELTEIEKENVKYFLLPDYFSSVNEEEINEFEKMLILFFQKKLNEYHNVNFDVTYWRKMFSGWLKPFIINCFDKIELLHNLKSCYPASSFESSVELGNEDGLLFAKLAEKVCFFSISYLEKKRDLNNDRLNRKDNIIFEFFLHIFLKVKRFKVKNIKVYFKNVKSKLLKWSTSRNKVVLVGYSYFPGSTIDFFRKKSNYKITTIEHEVLTEERVKDVSRDNAFRKQLKIDLTSMCNHDNDSWKIFVCDVLCDFLPSFYIEKFKQYLNYSKMYLRRNKKLRYIFTVCINAKSLFTFLCIYAQFKGVKLGTMAHGGNYGLGQEVYDYEAAISNFFYGWGKWTDDVVGGDSIFKSCPTHRLSALYDNQFKSNDFFLFVGADLSFFHDRIGSMQKFRVTNFKCLQNRIKFFKSLDSVVLERFLLRNHPFDSGYHETRFVSEVLPCLHIDGFVQAAFDDNIGGVNGRNETFSRRCLRCALLIYDDIETPFTEALYLDKPFVLLLVDGRYSIRCEELPYLKMMQDVGLLFYNPEECAALINSIYNSIDDWWMDEKRQRVVSAVKDRYVLHSENVDEWWLGEFSEIAGLNME